MKNLLISMALAFSMTMATGLKMISNWQSLDGDPLDFVNCFEEQTTQDCTYQTEIAERCHKAETLLWSADIDPTKYYTDALIVSSWMNSYESGDATKHTNIRVGFTHFSPVTHLDEATAYANWVDLTAAAGSQSVQFTK